VIAYFHIDSVKSISHNSKRILQDGGGKSANQDPEVMEENPQIDLNQNRTIQDDALI
jgi:hypothetical protein